ncbi:MAG: hypothetical protein KAI66_08745 [Lentisphaeria bacterium]|nr:hypothetical protein [Lentisphaeria bacterium]
MKQHSGESKRHHSFGRALFQILVLGIFLPAGMIWTVGHFTARAAVAFLWDGLSDEISGHTVERTLRYLETGSTALDYNRFAVALGLVDPRDRRAMLRYLLAVLEANPNITWYSFGSADGAYLSAYRSPDGGLRLTWREQEEDGARYRDFRVLPDGGWEALEEKVKPYDPRTRGWYQAALEKGRQTWSEPFLFASGPPGFILSGPACGTEGEVIGVWATEYEMSYVSEFLAGLQIGRHGRAYLVTASGEVIGHPVAGAQISAADGWIVVEKNGRKTIATASTHRDPWLRRAFAVTDREGEPIANAKFEVDGDAYLCAATSFPAESGLDWRVLIVLPEKDILGIVHRNSLWTGIAAILIAVLFLFLGHLQARRRLSRPLADIAQDLEEMSRLETESTPRVVGSRISEVQGMVRAREVMRAGLRSFKKYVSADLVQELMENGQEARLGGEERELTVMFSDMVGFTRISEELGEPKVLVEALSHYLGAMSEVIVQNGGTVDKYVGDAIIAFWGAPHDHPTHALSACEAAWESQVVLGELRESWVAAGLPRFRARIGVNTGKMLVGNIGSVARMNYTVMGDHVNLGSRLEGLCKIYGLEIAVGETTRDAVREVFECRPVDYVEVKGRSQAVLFYELLGKRGSIDESRLAAAEIYAQALDLYLAREFGSAKDAFQHALDLRPDDVAARELIKRCELYIREAPPDDWSGVVRMSRKR